MRKTKSEKGNEEWRKVRKGMRESMKVKEESEKGS